MEEEIMVSVRQPCHVCQSKGRIVTHTAGDIHCAHCEGTGLMSMPVLLSVHLGSMDEKMSVMMYTIENLQNKLAEAEDWAEVVCERLDRSEQRLRAAEDQIYGPANF